MLRCCWLCPCQSCSERAPGHVLRCCRGLDPPFGVICGERATFVLCHFHVVLLQPAVTVSSQLAVRPRPVSSICVLKQNQRSPRGAFFSQLNGG